MSTVSKDPVPPKTITPKAFPPRFDYGQPTSGGPPIAGKSEGNPPSTAAPAGVAPSMAAYSPAPYRGEVPGTSGTMVGPDFGHGATQVTPDSGDRPSGGKAAANLGTAGDSGDQGPGPGSPGFSETGRDE